MATITRENIGVLNEKIVVKVAKDDYLPSFQKAIKDYSKKANIPGFRKGMVPAGMVKKMYGSSVFAEEVVKSVEKGLSEYMKNEKLQIFAQPLPLNVDESPKLDMNQPDEYQFSFEVGLKPEFSLADLGNAQLTKYKVDVTYDMINEDLERLQIRSGKMVGAETVTSDDNELNLTLIESDAEGIEIADGIRKKTSLQVKFFNPEVRNELMGKKKEDVLTIQLSKAFGEKENEKIIADLGLAKEDPETANKFFKLLIDNVSLMEKANLDTEFFKQVFPDKEITSEEELKNQLKAEIEHQWDNQSRNQLHDQIYHELLNHTKIEFPEDFLKRWMLTGTEKQKTPEEVELEFPRFVNQLKWNLITDKIVHENNLEVNADEIISFAKAQLLGYMGNNINLDQPWIMDYIDRMMKDKKYVDDSYHQVLIQKIFDWSETQVHPTEAIISEEEFTKMLESHKHEH